MKSAIIIGTHNNAGHVVETIHSVRAQSDQDWRCLVIDNGSTDSTAEVVRGAIEGDGRFCLFKKANEGPSAFRNMGFEKVRGQCQYIHFLDGDDMLKRDFLRVLGGHLDRNPQAGVVACQFDVVNEGGLPIGAGFRTRYARGMLGLPRRLADSEVNTPFEGLFAATGQGPFAVFRAEVFAKTSGYEPAFWSHEDSDIFCQMALLAEVHYLPERLYTKRVHGANLTTAATSDYGKFRDKWDLYCSDSAEVNARVEQAFRYYHGVHAPLRHFKIGLMAMGEIVRGRESGSWRWAMACFGKGFADFCLKRALRKRWAEREQARLARQRA